MQRSYVIRFVIGTILIVMLTLLVAFNSLLFWVATGPRSLQHFTPYLERSLTGESSVHAKIGETWLIWDGWKHPIDIRLVDVSLLTKDNVTFSKFPQISLGIDVLALMFGEILPTSISVNRPVVSIKQNADKTLGFRLAPKEGEIGNTTDTLAALIESLINPHSKSSLRKLHTIELLHADASIENEKDGVVISAPDTTFIVRKESAKKINVILHSVLQYGEHESPIDGQFAYNKYTKSLEGVVDASKMQLAVLSDILSDDPLFHALQLPLTGKVGFAFNTSGKLDALKFVFEGGKGRIVHEKLDGALPIQHLKISGGAEDGLTRISIEEANIDFGGSELHGKADIINNEKGLGITGDINLSNVETNQAHLFWPLGLAPLSREWVVSNIHEGNITKASAVINIKQGQLEHHALPKEAVDALIELKDAKIRYLPDHPEVRGVNATIRVDGQSLDATVATASAFTDTRLSNGRVLIADLVPDNPLLEVSLHADAPASDIVTLLGLPMLEHAKHLNLDAKKVSGRASGDAKLGFYFFAKDENGNDTPLTYEISTKLDNVSSPAFLKRFDIEHASGDMTINEAAIEYNGSAVVNGGAISAGKIRYDFEPQNGVDTTIAATGTVNEAVLKRFGVSLPIAIREAPGVAISAQLNTHKDATSIPQFSLKGEGVNVAGNAILTADGTDLAALKLTKVLYDKTDLESLEYAAIDGGFMLKMDGKSLDISSMFGGKKEGDTGFSFEHFPAIDLAMDIDTVHAAYDQDIENVKGTLNCTATRCGSANIKGNVGDKKLSFVIASDKAKTRKLTVLSENAGAVVRALGITESMQEGSLNLSGQFDETGALSGKLFINDYTLKNAPILARMLSLASLTGFFDTLSGKGISFKKLSVPFTLKDDVITIKDMRTYGPAIGITADGTITFPATGLKIEGTIVPSYTLNNVIGKVPLLGDLLMGGEGQGVFAARYTVKGDTDNPEVMVNPLSILTPGFLRNLFDVF